MNSELFYIDFEWHILQYFWSKVFDILILLSNNGYVKENYPRFKKFQNQYNSLEIYFDYNFFLKKAQTFHFLAF